MSVAKGVAYRLSDEGHAVDLIHDGAEALAFLRHDAADLIILDVTLPGMSGLDVLRHLRAAGDQRPVLMLTAQSETADRIEGLDAGADDYLVKPFEMEELIARIRAISRRNTRPQRAEQRIGELRFDSDARMIIGPDGPLTVPRREVSLFETLLSANGRTVSKQVLLDHLYGTGSDVDEPVVEVYVSRLRKRLRPFGVEIKVQRGIGYAMTRAAL